MAPSPVAPAAPGGSAALPPHAAAPALPEWVDTVIVGSGPSALILSYILNGRQPFVRANVAHPDAQLQAKLAGVASLLDADWRHLAAHFPASRWGYSTQALPVNTLLDTLLRPLGDTAPGLHDSCITWRATEHVIDHVVLGADPYAGGQWQQNPVASSRDIAALSYADLLTLPEYTMADYLRERGLQDADTGFLRPTRSDVAGYFEQWPARVGIQASLRLGLAASGIERTADGCFYIGSHRLHCRHLVLASGTFAELILPREVLRPLLRLTPPPVPDPEPLPLLVVGSGFSAADVILTCLPQGRRVLHLFKWDPAEVASPLRACHVSAYPDYAGVFRRMRRAAEQLATAGKGSQSPDTQRAVLARRKSSSYALEAPALDALYEGLPNTWIHSVMVRPDGTGATVVLDRPGGGLMEREVCGLQYVIGRRGSLTYLDGPLRAQVLEPDAPAELISAGRPIRSRMLRPKAERSASLAMAPGVYAIGSLLGDSLIRHAYGGCVVVAHALLAHHEVRNKEGKVSGQESQLEPAAQKDAEGPQETKGSIQQVPEPQSTPALWTNGHEHLGDPQTAVHSSRRGASYDCADDEGGRLPEHAWAAELRAF